MASLVLSGDTSGSITVSAPAVAGSTTQTLVNVTGTLAPIVSGTAQTAPFTDNTRAEFTSIPPWVKRITVMFQAVGTNGTSNLQIQIGSGSFATSNYTSACTYNSSGNAPTVLNVTSGFLLTPINGATEVMTGIATIVLISSNSWVFSGSLSDSALVPNVNTGTGSIALGGTLDRIRVLAVNGTDTFDTGSVINILFE